MDNNNNNNKRKHSSTLSSSTSSSTSPRSSSSSSSSTSPNHQHLHRPTPSIPPQPSSQKIKISLKIPTSTLETHNNNNQQQQQQPEERPKIKLRLFSKQLSSSSQSPDNIPLTLPHSTKTPEPANTQQRWSPAENKEERNRHAGRDQRESTYTTLNSKTTLDAQSPPYETSSRSCSRSPSSRPSDQYPYQPYSAARASDSPSFSRASSRADSVGPDYSTSRPHTPAPAVASKLSSTSTVSTETPTATANASIGPGTSGKGKKPGGKGKTRGSGYTYVRKGKGTGIAWAPRKKELSVICLKLLESFRRKDPYGFFLEPVDTTVITDYLTVVSTPMDFGTMKTKAETGKYRNLEEFKADFDLVIRNAKTYNGPSTVYWRTADKISEYGHKSIERDASTVMTEEEVQAERAKEEAKRLRKMGKSGKKGLKAAGLGNAGPNIGTPSAIADARHQRRSQSYMSTRGEEDLDVDGTGFGTPSALGGYTLSYQPYSSAAQSPNSGGASFSMGTPMQSSSYFSTPAQIGVGNNIPPPFHPDLVNALGSDKNSLESLEVDLNSTSAFTTLLDTPFVAPPCRSNITSTGIADRKETVDYTVVTAALDADGAGVAIVQKRNPKNKDVSGKGSAEVGMKAAGLNTRTYLPDGSVDCGANDPASIVPGYNEIEEGMVNQYSGGYGMIMAPRLTLIASRQSDAADMPTKIATFLDYGPFATLGPPTAPKSVEHSSYLYLTYGDERGEAYVRSLETFVMGSVGDETGEESGRLMEKLNQTEVEWDEVLIKEEGTVL